MSRVQELEQQRNYAAKEVASRNVQIAAMEARHLELSQQCSVLEDRCKSLVSENTDLRSHVRELC